MHSGKKAFFSSFYRRISPIFINDFHKKKLILLKFKWFLVNKFSVFFQKKRGFNKSILNLELKFLEFLFLKIGNSKLLLYTNLCINGKWTVDVMPTASSLYSCMTDSQRYPLLDLESIRYLLFSQLKYNSDFVQLWFP